MKKYLTILLVLFFGNEFLFCQNDKTLTFNNVIELSREQSPQAVLAKHRFRGSYWRYRSYQAGLLPNLSLNATIPDLNRSIDKITLPDGTDAFVERKLITSSANLSLSQNLPFTGGNIFVNSDLQRIDLLGPKGQSSYLSTPITVGLRQPISGFNSYKWERKIEPLLYQEAAKAYVSSLEEVSLRASELFFDLALAQMNQQISSINYSNADTLYKIARGRYNIGTIAQNELLQMELSLLNAGTGVNEAKVDLELRKFRLRSFLGFNDQVDIRLILPESIPEVEVEYNKALNNAMENNPEIISHSRELLEAQRDVSKARADKGINANLFATYGLTERADNLPDAYVNPQDQQRVRIGFEIPILDWGQGRGRFKMAQSSQEVVRTQVEQARTDFQQDVYLQVMRFNLQDDQVAIASKADTVAQLRYDVTKQRFLIGKIDVLDLNVALSEKDVAKRAYVQALRTYWNYYYNIRKLTLYNFLENHPLQEDIEQLVD